MDLNNLLQGMGPMKEHLDRIAAERAEILLEGRAGGGAVTVRLRGDLRIEGLTIAPAAAAASEDDVTMLEDLIQAAINDALHQYRQRFGATPAEQMEKSMAGSDIGALLGPLLGGLGR